MTRTLTILTGSALLLCATAQLDAADIRLPLVDRLATAEADELIPISIILAETPDVASLDLQERTKADRREAVIDVLKTHTERTARDLMTYLKNEQKVGNVGPRLKSLWIANAVATSATPDVIRALAERDDIKHINFDELRETLLVAPNPSPTLAIECGVDLMNAPDAWAMGYTGAGVVVGVIDTGVCITHPDIANQIWNNPAEIPGNNIDDDNNGYVDDVVGWNFRDDTDNPFDDNGHGSHVAGTVAGDGTSGEESGVAPDASIMVLKYSNQLSGESIAWEAIQYGTDNGADVLSGSFGWRHAWNPDRETWRNTCDNSIAAGVVMVFASGNEGQCCIPDNVRTPGDVPSVITVGATDCSDNIASFSSTGPVSWSIVSPFFDYPLPPGLMKPEVTAPGDDTLSHATCSGYTTLSGTSMATPHVSGAIALMLQANPDLTPAQVKEGLQSTAIDLGSIGPDNIYGSGRVDALAAILEGSFPCDSDINEDGTVDVSDLLTVLANWGPFGNGTGDLNGDGTVNVSDVLTLLASWGPCPTP